jgi:amidophosphoribosyltransferase
MEDGRVNGVRWNLGVRLADEWKAKGLSADVVVAIPDTSRDAASAMAERLGLPNREGFIKNRYIGRTFIMPNQATRDAALRLKLNPIREVFDGRRVILVDDSIVRGSTMRRIVKMVKELRPEEVHLAIFSPPVQHPCFYGIDMPSHDELVAAKFAPQELEAELAKRFGVDSVTYITVDGLRAVTGDRMCTACFTGEYVVPVSDEERGFILENRHPMDLHEPVLPPAVR